MTTGHSNRPNVVGACSQQACLVSGLQLRGIDHDATKPYLDGLYTKVVANPSTMAWVSDSATAQQIILDDHTFCWQLRMMPTVVRVSTVTALLRQNHSRSEHSFDLLRWPLEALRSARCDNGIRISDFSAYTYRTAVPGSASIWNSIGANQHDSYR